MLETKESVNFRGPTLPFLKLQVRDLDLNFTKVVSSIMTIILFY